MEVYENGELVAQEDTDPNGFAMVNYLYPLPSSVFSGPYAIAASSGLPAWRRNLQRTGRP